ncbi:MAG: glycosyltransferase family 4 protein [Steroidobacteraceae bacterium]|jgi:glycosyltransferase involved in cell wall biosynthesis|nr:glycosyltransferase family 4 protein [Steroidobacteraceae bacterium]
MTARGLRILFFPREPYPTDRVRIEVLFGRELAARGHRVDLVAQAADARTPPGRRRWSGGEVALGSTDDGRGFLRRLRKRWRGFAHAVRSLSLVDPLDYDVLVVSDTFWFAVLAGAAARRKRVPFVYWLTFPYPELELHGARTGTARYPWAAALLGHTGAWLLYRRILPQADHVFVQSERMGRAVAAHGVDERRISPVLTGFCAREIVAVGPRRAPAGDTPVIAYLGTLSADRQLEVVIDALALLHAGGLRARLLLVGDAHRERDRLALERRALERGVSSHVAITGFLPQPEAVARAAEADVCISPIPRTPIFEVGSPTKLVEYLALGLPVVANDHPEQRDILRASRAGVCVPWGARHFARALAWLLARAPDERVAMGRRGREWIEANRSYARLADDVERTLRRLAREHEEAVCRGSSTPGALGGAETRDL